MSYSLTIYTSSGSEIHLHDVPLPAVEAIHGWWMPVDDAEIVPLFYALRLKDKEGRLKSDLLLNRGGISAIASSVQVAEPQPVAG